MRPKPISVWFYERARKLNYSGRLYLSETRRRRKKKNLLRPKRKWHPTRALAQVNPPHCLPLASRMMSTMVPWQSECKAQHRSCGEGPGGFAAFGVASVCGFCVLLFCLFFLCWCPSRWFGLVVSIGGCSVGLFFLSFWVRSGDLANRPQTHAANLRLSQALASVFCSPLLAHVCSFR